MFKGKSNSILELSIKCTSTSSFTFICFPLKLAIKIAAIHSNKSSIALELYEEQTRVDTLDSAESFSFSIFPGPPIQPQSLHQLPGGPRRQTGDMGTVTAGRQHQQPPDFAYESGPKRRDHVSVQTAAQPGPGGVQGRAVKSSVDRRQFPFGAELFQAQSAAFRSHLRVRTRTSLRTSHYTARDGRGDTLSLLRGYR